MSYHDLLRETRRLNRANRKLTKTIHRLAEENGDGTEFALHDPPATKKPWRGSLPENTRQTLLIAGMDCLREPRRFTIEKRRKRPGVKPVIEERAGWTAEQWREWFALEFPTNQAAVGHPAIRLLSRRDATIGDGQQSRCFQWCKTARSLLRLLAAVRTQPCWPRANSRAKPDQTVIGTRESSPRYPDTDRGGCRWPARRSSGCLPRR